MTFMQSHQEVFAIRVLTALRTHDLLRNRAVLLFHIIRLRMIYWCLYASFKNENNPIWLLIRQHQRKS